MTLDIPRILEELRRSSLLDADRLGSATIRECATSTDPEVLRAALQSFGIFTPFQIERIDSGE